MSEDTLQERPQIRRRLRALFQNRFLSDFGRQFSYSSSSVDRLLSLTIPISRIDPLACVEVLGQPGEFQFYWEHPERDFGLAGGKSCLSISAEGSSRFQQVEDRIQQVRNKSREISEIEHTQAGLHFLGGFSFNGHTTNNQLWANFGSASFHVPEWLFVRDGNLGLLTLTLDISDHRLTAADIDQQFESRVDQLQPLLDFQQEHDGIVKKSEPCWDSSNKSLVDDTESEDTYEQWTKHVNHAKDLIREGAFEKIVLSRKIQVENNGSISPTQAINRLRNLYTNCYCFFIEFPGSGSFIGCSPERLVQFNKRYILTDALAGSISRGTSASRDMVFENRLLSSGKNRDEHEFVVKSITHRLKNLTTRIQHPSSPVVKKLSNVQHLHTPILAWLKSDTRKSDVMRHLHPTPAVGGYPTEKALSYIPKLELFDRGWFAGPVGWFNTMGGGEFTVAIRSGLIQSDQAHFFAGCGIVEDSDANEEWEETKLKLIPMLSSVENG